MYQNDPNKVLTGEVRLSYAHLTTPQAPAGGGDPVYSCTLLIPKTDTATFQDICAAIDATRQAGAPKWGNRIPAMLNTPLYDGDGVMPSGEPWGDECCGHWVLRTKANVGHQPMVVHQSNIRTPLAPSDIYSGMYARVTVRFYAYAANGNNGIGAGLGNVMKTRDGEPLSGSGATAEQDFAGLEVEQIRAVPAAPAAPGYPVTVPSIPAYQQPVPAAPMYQPAVPAAAPVAATPATAAAPAINPLTGMPYGGYMGQ